MVLGSRMMTPGAARAGGMPLWKRIANRFLTTLENLAMGRRFTECHTGYRAYSRRFLETVPFLRNCERLRLRHRGDLPGRPASACRWSRCRSRPATSRTPPRWASARASSTASARSGRRCASCCTARGSVLEQVPALAGFARSHALSRPERPTQQVGLHGAARRHARLPGGRLRRRCQPDEAALRATDGTFAPVEQCWHLADLEREGYLLGIGRLLSRGRPGAARFRRRPRSRRSDATSRSRFAEGLRAFRTARAETLAHLRTVGRDLEARRTAAGRGSRHAVRRAAMIAAARRRAPRRDRGLVARARGLTGELSRSRDARVRNRTAATATAGHKSLSQWGSACAHAWHASRQ